MNLFLVLTLLLHSRMEASTISTSLPAVVQPQHSSLAGRFPAFAQAALLPALGTRGGMVCPVPRRSLPASGRKAFGTGLHSSLQTGVQRYALGLYGVGMAMQQLTERSEPVKVSSTSDLQSRGEGVENTSSTKHKPFVSARTRVLRILLIAVSYCNLWTCNGLSTTPINKTKLLHRNGLASCPFHTQTRCQHTHTHLSQLT